MRRGKEAGKLRRKAAEKRNEQRASRTDKQQLAKLDQGGYLAVRERTKLSKRIEAKHEFKNQSKN